MDSRLAHLQAMHIRPSRRQPDSICLRVQTTTRYNNTMHRVICSIFGQEWIWRWPKIISRTRDSATRVLNQLAYTEYTNWYIIFAGIVLLNKKYGYRLKKAHGQSVGDRLEMSKLTISFEHGCNFWVEYLLIVNLFPQIRLFETKTDFNRSRFGRHGTIVLEHTQQT